MKINTRQKHSARIPRNLTRTLLPEDVSTMIQTEAIEVFTAMTNAGQSFQHALMAVFLSGMSAAKESME